MTDTVTLAMGSRMPLLGFGTWQIHDDEAVRASAAALEAGYRHLDTATVYGNEREVGRALAESGVPRDEVFLTTKCPPDRAGRELDTLRRSLDLLQTDHVDLWLIHWPGAAVYLLPWNSLHDQSTVEAGFQQATYAVIGFGVGSIIFAPLCRRYGGPRVKANSILLEDQRIAGRSVGPPALSGEQLPQRLGRLLDRFGGDIRGTQRR